MLGSHNNDGVIVIGKTFEATTLEDGSEQVIEHIRYKRLNDGCIWTESNAIQLNDIDDIMRDTGVEDELEKKQAPTWSMSYSGSESVSTVDAAELDAALSASTNEEQGDPARRHMYQRSMNTDAPNLTPKYNRGGWGGQLFSPNISFDEESSVHHDKQQNHMRTFFASPDNGNNRRSEACDGDDSDVISDKRRLQRKKRCMLLFLYICLIIAGVVVASFVLKLWLMYKPSANQAPENADASDEISDTTASDMSDSVAVDMIDGAVNGELPEPENVEAINTEQVDVAKEDEVTTNVVEEAIALADTADVEEDAVSPCIQLKITTTADKESTDITPWSLTRSGENESTIVIRAADSLSFDDSNTFYKCVDPGLYTFHISDSGGDGLGERGKTGYIISADGIDFGVSTWFLDDEKMTFSLTLVHGIDSGFCSDDFLLVIKTDNKPFQTRWDVIDNDYGETVLQGGPYSLPQSIHTQRACLSDGNYTFNMHDLGGDGVCCDDGKGFFSLYKNGVEVVDSNGEFGNKNSTVFVVSSP